MPAAPTEEVRDTAGQATLGIETDQTSVHMVCSGMTRWASARTLEVSRRWSLVRNGADLAARREIDILTPQRHRAAASFHRT